MKISEKDLTKLSTIRVKSWTKYFCQPKTVSDLNYKIVGIKKFPDHHAFNQQAINKLIELAKTLKADYIVTTEKDWVKLDSLKLNFPFIIVDIKIEIIEKNVLKNLFNF